MSLGVQTGNSNFLEYSSIGSSDFKIPGLESMFLEIRNDSILYVTFQCRGSSKRMISKMPIENFIC